MNAYTFLGKDNIDNLLNQGWSADQINDYAKSEYQKQNTQNNMYSNNGHPYTPAKAEDWGTKPSEDEGFFANAWNNLKNAPIWNGNFGGDANYMPQTKEQKQQSEAFIETVNKTNREAEQREHLNDMRQEMANVINKKGAFSQIFGDDETKKQMVAETKDALKSKFGVNAELGDDGSWYAFEQQKDGQYIPQKIDPNIINHIVSAPGETVLPIAAAIATAPVSLPAAIGASALAAGAGTIADQYINDQADNMSAGDMAKRAAEAAGLDMVAAGLGAGAGKVAPAIASATGKVLTKATNMAKNTPILRTLLTQNADSAIEFAHKNLNADVGEIMELYEKHPQFEVRSINQIKDDYLSAINSKLEKLPISDERKKLASEYIADKAAKLTEAMRHGDTDSIRDEILKISMATENGGEFVSRILREHGELKPQAYDLITKTIKDWRTAVKDLGLGENDNWRSLLKDYQGAVKGNYDEMKAVIDEGYQGKTVQIPNETIDNLAEEIYEDIGSSGISETWINKLIGKMRGAKSFDELNRLRTDLNAKFENLYTESASGARNYYGRQAAGKVREVIDNAVDNLLKQSDNLYPKARAAYNAAKSEYGDMLKASDYKFNKYAAADEKLQSETVSQMLKSLDNQGSTFKNYVDSLPAELQERAEIYAVRDIVENSIKKTDGGVEYLDAAAALPMLQKLQIKNTQALKFLELATDLSKLARGHAKTAAGIGKIKMQGEVASISTTVKGSAEQVMSRRIVNFFWRNLPIGDKAATRAYQYNLEKALKNSRVISDFTSNLEKRVNNKEIINSTARQAIKDLVDELNSGPKGNSLFDSTIEGSPAISKNAANEVEEIITPEIKQATPIKEAAQNEAATEEVKAQIKAEMKSELESLRKDYDLAKFLNDRAKVGHKDVAHGKKVSIKAESRSYNAGDGWVTEYTKPVYEKNYNADFVTTKADVKALRKAIVSGNWNDRAKEALNKVKADLGSADALGYTQYLKAKPAQKAIDKVFENDGKYFATYKDGSVGEITKDKYDLEKGFIPFASPTVGGGLVGGTLNGVSVDEQGNTTFDRAKFATGFIGGVIAAKTLSKIAEKGAKIHAEKIAEAYPGIAKGNPALLSKIATQSLRDFIGDTLKKADGTIHNRAFKKLVDLATGKNYVIAGENAYASNNAKQGIHRAKLAEAQKMSLAGKDEKEIWDKTGWFYDELDKKWKFEINPSGGVLDLAKIKSISKDEPRTLADILKDNELFEAYPTLKQAKVAEYKFADGADASIGHGSDGKSYILISPALKGQSLDEIKSTLYHEIQHIIQGEEKFSGGASLDVAADYSAAQTKKREAYFAEHKAELDELQAKRKANEKAPAETDEELDNWLRTDEELGDKIKRIKDKAPKAGFGYTPENLYLRQGGEVEARNVSTRLNPDKQSSAPLDTLDVPKEARINMGNSDEAMSVELESLFSKNGGIDKKALMRYASHLPQAFKNIGEFKKAVFGNKNVTRVNQNLASVKTPLGEVKITPATAYIHLNNNSKGENRQYLSGGVIDTLVKPLFVTKNGDGVRFYYKPFIGNDRQIHLVSVVTDKKGNMVDVTNYNAEKSRLISMIKKYDLEYLDEALHAVLRDIKTSPEKLISQNNLPNMQGNTNYTIPPKQSQGSRADRIADLKSQIGKAVRNKDNAEASKLRKQLGALLKNRE